MGDGLEDNVLIVSWQMRLSLRIVKMVQITLRQWIRRRLFIFE